MSQNCVFLVKFSKRTFKELSVTWRFHLWLKFPVKTSSSDNSKSIKCPRLLKIMQNINLMTNCWILPFVDSTNKNLLFLASIESLFYFLNKILQCTVNTKMVHGTSQFVGSWNACMSGLYDMNAYKNILPVRFIVFAENARWRVRSVVLNLANLMIP